MNYYYTLKFSFIMMLFGASSAVYGQDTHLREGMNVEVPNYTSFNSVEPANLEEWKKYNLPEYYDHPEFGRLVKEAPCQECVEDLSKRKEDERYFIDIKDPTKFYLQKALGNLNALRDRDWITIDHKLKPVSNGVYESGFTMEQTGFNMLEHKVYIKTVNGIVYFNNWSAFTVSNNVETSIGEFSWANYTIGESGVYVTNAFPGIDAEMKVLRGVIKTNFIVKSNQFGVFDNLVFRDQFDGPSATTNQFVQNEGNLGVGEFSVFSGNLNLLHVGEAILSVQGGPKDLVRSAEYKLNGNLMDIIVPFDWINANIGSYYLIVDPTVTGTASLAQLSITGSRYNASCNLTNSCDYNLTVASPANATLTNVAWTFTYSANGTACYFEDGGIRISTGSCISPSDADFIWGCSNPFFPPYGGTCAGTSIPIFSDLSSCLPAPSCSPQNVTFTLKFYRSCFGVTGNGCNSGTCIGAASPWTMTITGQTIVYTNTSTPITLSATTICAGGSITASTVGQYGVPGYTYNWSLSPTGSPSVGTGASTSVTFPTAGSVTLYSFVTDACGNQVTSSRVITVTTGPVITVNSPSICVGGSAVLTATGATSYTWTPSGTLTSGTGSSVTATPTITTTYTVTGTTGTCSGTTTSTVTVTPGPTITVNSPTICAGASAVLTATGGTTYTWTPSGTLSSGTGSPVTATPTITTTYTVTGTTSGCSGTATSTVTVTPLPTIVVNSPTICAGSSAVLTATGGTTYTWTPSATLSSGTGSPVTATPTLTTTYTVTGTASGCSNTATSTVTVTSNPVITVNSPTICAGASATLTATGATSYTWTPSGTLSSGTGSSVTATPTVTTTYTVTGTTGTCSGTATSTVTVTPGPTITVNSPTICAGASAVLTATGGTTYSWTPSGTLSSGTGSPVTATPTITTTYTVTGTTSGCSGTATSTVTVTPLPTVSVNSPAICEGSSATLTATGAASYTWTPAGTLSSGTGSPVTATPTGTTTYTVTGTDNGCSSTATSTVTVTPLPTITVNSPTICAGASATLTAAGGATYTWTPSATLSSGTGSPVTATPAVTTTYTVVGTDNGCSSSASSTVTVTPLPTITVNSPSVCAGNPATLSATGAAAYAWTPSGTLSSGIGSPVTATPAVTTTYTVTGTTSGCSNTATSTVTVNPIPTVTAANNGPLCQGLSLNLTATGQTGATYSWTGPGTFVSTAQNPQLTSVTAADAGTYTVTITLNGCSSTASTIFSLTPGAVSTINPNGPYCVNGSPVILSAVSPGGTWSGTGITNTATGAFDPSLATVGNNSVTYTIPGGCGGSSTATIVVNTAPVPSFTASATLGCSPLKIKFTNTTNPATTSVLWDFGNGSSSTLNAPDSVVYISDGCYTISLTATDANGCAGTTTSNSFVCVIPDPVAQFHSNSSTQTIMDPDFHFINTSANSVSYEWNFGDNLQSTATNPDHTYPGQAGSYTVRLIAWNSAGCRDTAYSIVNVQEDLIFYVPNTFTPNGDERNNTFDPVFTSGVDAANFSMIIYNRWGETLFETKDPEKGWDGTYHDKIVPEGVYIWTLRFKNPSDDKKYEYRGNVNVFK